MVMQGSSHRLLVLLGALLLTWVRTPAQGPPAVPTPAEEEPLSFTANAALLQGNAQALFVWSAVFSPDGGTLAVVVGGAGAVPGELRLCDVARRQERLLLKEEKSPRCAAFAPDGRTLAVGSFDNTATLRDAATGQVRTVFKGH